MVSEAPPRIVIEYDAGSEHPVNLWNPGTEPCNVIDGVKYSGEFVGQDYRRPDMTGGAPCPTGGSPATEIAPSGPCMSATTPPTNTEMGGCAACSRGREKRSSCALAPETPDLFGATSYPTPTSEGSTAPFSATKARSYRPSLSDQADDVADAVWACRRHYTYVDPSAVRSANPGFCFLMAGWRRCGMSANGKTIMERAPT